MPRYCRVAHLPCRIEPRGGQLRLRCGNRRFRAFYRFDAGAYLARIAEDYGFKPVGRVLALPRAGVKVTINEGFSRVSGDDAGIVPPPSAIE